MYFLTILFLLFNFSWVRASGIYDISVKDHLGKEISLKQYEGKVLLIVNVASLCGYTDTTYRAITRLHDILSFGDHFSVLAFPCNQFGEQEPREAPEILSAMEENYGIEFPLMSKIDVIGSDASPLYKYLIDQSSIVPDWNFYKYLVSSKGEVLNAWGTTTTIEEIFDDIQSAVEEAKKSKGSEGAKPLEDDKERKDEDSAEKDEL